MLVCTVGEDTNDFSISEDHPDIIAAMTKVEQQTKSVDSTAEVFIEAFSEGVRMAEEKRREDKNDNRSHGGWIIDGFPLTRSHWSSMIDANLLPDAVLSLENTNKDKNILLKRFCFDKGLPDPTLFNQDEKKTETSKDGNQVYMYMYLQITMYMYSTCITVHVPLPCNTNSMFYCTLNCFSLLPHL